MNTSDDDNDDDSMDTIPCDIPDADPFTVASTALKQLAHENGFNIS